MGGGDFANKVGKPASSPTENFRRLPIGSPDPRAAIAPEYSLDASPPCDRVYTGCAPPPADRTTTTTTGYFFIVLPPSSTAAGNKNTIIAVGNRKKKRLVWKYTMAVCVRNVTTVRRRDNTVTAQHNTGTVESY